MPTTRPSLYIILATCNGEAYLKAQIDSIRAQTYTDWRLLIRDDASRDRTRQIADDAASQDSRIEVMAGNNCSAAGAAANFAILLTAAHSAGASLCFFADQDDIWSAHKLARQLRFFPDSGWERQPILAHSDMSLIDGSGAELSPSFFRFRKLTPEPLLPVNQLLSINYISGCTLCINRRLMELGNPLPAAAIMHDWWLALLAAAGGDIRYDPVPLSRYRQHEANTIGASGEGAILRDPRRWMKSWVKGNADLAATFDQAKEVIGRLEQRGSISRDTAAVIDQYLFLPQMRKWNCLRTAHEMGLREGKPLLRLALYLHLIMHGD